MKTLYKLKDMLCKELEEYGDKGELTAGSLDIVDKLTHALKSIETIIAMNESDEYSGRYDGDSGRYDSGRYSGARGRGRYARRDSMGRYASRASYDNGSYSDRSYRGPYYGRSYDDGTIDELREIAENMTDERKRQELQDMIERLEHM